MLARVKQLETCNREMFGDVVVTCQAPAPKALLPQIEPYVPPIIFENRKNGIQWRENEKRRASVLVDQLLSEIYANESVSDSATSSRSCGVCRMDERSLWEKGECLIYWCVCGGDKWFINFLWKHDGRRVITLAVFCIFKTELKFKFQKQVMLITFCF